MQSVMSSNCQSQLSQQHSYTTSCVAFVLTVVVPFNWPPSSFILIARSSHACFSPAGNFLHWNESGFTFYVINPVALLRNPLANSWQNHFDVLEVVSTNCFNGYSLLHERLGNTDNGYTSRILTLTYKSRRRRYKLQCDVYTKNLDVQK